MKTVLEIKISGNEVLQLIKTLFSRLFFGFSMIWYKKVSGKKSSYNWKCIWERRMFKTMEKRAWYQKHPWLYSICRCIEEKSVSRKRLRLDLIFPRHRTFVSLGVINSCDLIFWDFIGRHHIILGKKVSGIYKTLDFISRGILSWDLKGL